MPYSKSIYHMLVSQTIIKWYSEKTGYSFANVCIFLIIHLFSTSGWANGFEEKALLQGWLCSNNFEYFPYAVCTGFSCKKLKKWLFMKIVKHTCRTETHRDELIEYLFVILSYEAEFVVTLKALDFTIEKKTFYGYLISRFQCK